MKPSPSRVMVTNESSGDRAQTWSYDVSYQLATPLVISIFSQGQGWGKASQTYLTSDTIQVLHREESES